MSRITPLLHLLLCLQIICIPCVTSRGFSFPWNTHNKKSNQSKDTSSCLSRTQAHEVLQTFLEKDDDLKAGQPPSVFHIQGWRWHTMSLLREAERLHQLAHRRPDDTRAVTQAIQYVVGFNMKALHRIETELFFPWVRKRVQLKNPVIGSALDVVLNQLEEIRQSVETIGSQLNKDATIISSPATSPSDHTLAVQSIAERSAQVAQHTRTMLHLENTLLVPSIARLIPESEQKAFNNQVIRNLGILDSRLHLVGMYEAVAHDPVELALFEQTIPSIPRKMIPRWKRLLYDPQAGVLNL